jgi:hypothetical protein
MLLLSLQVFILKSLDDFLSLTRLKVLKCGQVALFRLELSINSILQCVNLLNQVCIHTLLVVLSRQYRLLDLTLLEVPTKRIFNHTFYSHLRENLF